MIGFERPEALLGILLAAPLLWWWHRRRRRPRAARVSSLLIWERLGAVSEASSRRRPSWLLLLEAAAALALVTAAAGPYRGVARPERARLTVLVDRRPGMGAVDATGRTRLDRARVVLGAFLSKRDPETRVRLLTVPPTPGGSATFSAGASGIRAALDALEPAAVPGDFDAAVASLDAHGGRRLVVTDEPAPAAGNRPGGPSWLSVGAPARNVGIIWARAEQADAGGATLSAGVMNGGTETVETRAALVLDARETASSRVTVAAGEVRALPAFSLETLMNRDFRLVLEIEDALAADDVVRFRPDARGAIALVAAEPVPSAVRRALVALGRDPIEVLPGGPPPSPPALYWKVAPPATARPPWVWVGGEGSAAGLQLGPGYRPTRVEPGPDASRVGGVMTEPTRVLRGYRVSGDTAGWRVRLQGVGAEGRRVPLLLDRPDGAVVLAFDPVGDAPGWANEPTFPAFFFAALGRAATGLAADGLLSPADTRLGAVAVSPAPDVGPAEPVRDTEPQIESLAIWLLLAAALALVGICLLEV